MPALLRILLAIPMVALYTIVLGVPTILAGLVDRSGRWSYAVVRLWARLVLAVCGVRVVLAGTENLPAGPAVYAANHGSALDIPILFGYLPVEFRMIHKKSLYWLPVVGWYLYLGGHVAIDRANPFRAKRSLEVAADRIRAGTSVAVFPEGTRSPDARVRIFKRGSFVLALNAGVPVVPLSLAGVKTVVPQGILTLRAGTVHVGIHPAVATAGRAADAAEALADEVRSVVVRACDEATA